MASIDFLFASAHFLYQISIFQSSFLVLRLLLFICERTSVFRVCYLFTKDCGPSLPVLYKKTAVLITRLVYKGLWSLSFAIHMQKTAVLVFHYPFAKDCCPYLVVYICKGLLSLSSAIHLQKTVVLVLYH